MILLIVIAETAHGQTANSINYRILEKEIRVSIANPKIVINVELMNTSNFDFLLPGLRNTFIMPPTVDFSWDSEEDKDGGGGNLFFLLTTSGERVKIWEDIAENHEDTTSMVASLKKAYFDNLVYLRKQEKIAVQVVVDLTKAGPVVAGKYSFYIIYASGKLAASVVNRYRPVRNASLQALVFEGYLKSNCIPLEIY